MPPVAGYLIVFFVCHQLLFYCLLRKPSAVTGLEIYIVLLGFGWVGRAVGPDGGREGCAHAAVKYKKLE